MKRKKEIKERERLEKIVELDNRVREFEKLRYYIWNIVVKNDRRRYFVKLEQ